MCSTSLAIGVSKTMWNRSTFYSGYFSGAYTQALYSVKPLSIFLEFKSHHCVTAWVNDSFTLVLD